MKYVDFLKASKKDTKHESDLSMLNQFFNGQGIKMTLAKSVERAVPKHSTCMTVILQQEAFLSGLTSLGSTLWKDTSFGE